MTLLLRDNAINSISSDIGEVFRMPVKTARSQELFPRSNDSWAMNVERLHEDASIEKRRSDE